MAKICKRMECDHNIWIQLGWNLTSSSDEGVGSGLRVKTMLSHEYGDRRSKRMDRYGLCRVKDPHTLSSRLCSVPQDWPQF
jgi:hypothetical protein